MDSQRPTPEVLEEMDRVFGALEASKERPRHKPPMGVDMVVLPKHYARFQIEPINFIASNGLDFLAGNIIKYTCRAEHKHADKGKEDMLKVIRYAFMRAKKLLGDPDWWKPYRNPALADAIVQELSHAP